MTDARRNLPAVNTLLEREAVQALARRVPREVVADAARAVVESVRRGAHAPPPSPAAWDTAIATAVDRALAPTLRRVVNATGVVLHTNLGRAPLSRAALAAITEVAGGYAALEYDIEAGARGSRHVHCAALLCELTGAEAAMVVNNCASALVLALNTLADQRDVVISRGELVEIGGSFRVPAIMAKGGARLVEVGTTNRTHLDDYRRAHTPATGAFLSVHRSNFAIDGFVASVAPRELAGLARELGVPCIHDFGSGLLLDLADAGLTGEPTARELVASGADVVVMSGDKLLGGPQAGIVLGRTAAIAAMRDNPLARAVRVDKLTLAALAATLAAYRDPSRARQEVPVLRVLTATADSVREQAAALVAACEARGVRCEMVPSEATVGGGAFPTARIPSSAVRLPGNAVQVEAALRTGDVPVIGRITGGAVFLDVRTIAADELVTVAEAVARAVRSAGASATPGTAS
ncbi:MAG: L-seryl-tRNA(Sec) selenium transferase [Gemmatimonadetes bacterium]|nr:L-seryl-tRNA(Sec) selenium transferase [Gemmatimonadota bacterium]